MTPQFSWSIDGAHSGVENMAIDEALLETGEGWLRFYTWSEPTLSLGYFQSHAARAEHPPSAACALVRRSTGGGAILHDRELTYSLVVPLDHPLARDPIALYVAFHEAISSQLMLFGVSALLRPAPLSVANRHPQLLALGTAWNETSENNSSAMHPFLCFHRRSIGDLLLGNTKIAGSAQRRRKRAILQHGSILLAASPYAPELPGIAELTSVTIEARELAEILAMQLSSALDIPRRPTSLPRGLGPAIDRAAREKFDNPAWTKRR